MLSHINQALLKVLLTYLMVIMPSQRLSKEVGREVRWNDRSQSPSPSVRLDQVAKHKCLTRDVTKVSTFAL